MNDVAKSYDAVARAYADHFFRELEAKPLDRALLDMLAEELRGKGIVADLGCGPGHAARYMSEHGVEMLGIDLSPKAIEEARRLSSHVSFETGSMLALAAKDASWAGAIALYAIVNLTLEELSIAFREMHRVLLPGAPLLISFHVGTELVHLNEMLGVPVSLDFQFFTREQAERALIGAGFEIRAWIERKAYVEEHPSLRGYSLARRGG